MSTAQKVFAPGTQVRWFVIEELLSTGNKSVVYTARLQTESVHTRRGRFVLKYLLPREGPEEEFIHNEMAANKELAFSEYLATGFDYKWSSS